jgi:hypothetical protein
MDGSWVVTAIRWSPSPRRCPAGGLSARLAGLLSCDRALGARWRLPAAGAEDEGGDLLACAQVAGGVGQAVVAVAVVVVVEVEVLAGPHWLAAAGAGLAGAALEAGEEPFFHALVR